MNRYITDAELLLLSRMYELLRAEVLDSISRQQKTDGRRNYCGGSYINIRFYDNYGDAIADERPLYRFVILRGLDCRTNSNIKNCKIPTFIRMRDELIAQKTYCAMGNLEEAV